MSSQYIVVGAGALGLASAEALLMQGASVTVLERGNVGQESSWAGGGILSPLCPWDYPEVVTQLAMRGAAKFADWAANLYATTDIDPEYQRSGMLVLPPFDKRAALIWCEKNHVQAEERDEGLLLPAVAQARNPRLLQAMRARVEKLGGKIVEYCEVKEFVAEGDAIAKVATTQGEFSATRYIVTAGAWSKQVLAERASQLSIKPIRGQMLLFKFDTPPLQYIVLQDGMYLIPRRDGHLLVGSTLEDVGFDKTTTDEVREMLLRRASVLLPALTSMPIVKHWAGLRPGSPNNIPTIGKHPRLANLYINSGHFRYGVTMAPASVEILLNEINGKSQPFDISPYRWAV
ncbi:MAG: FAD-dependent oxidoreductase [Gallionellaceae bacterium]|nr:FAD-dependent oxidoreductase [Gallionellaceae bacterium]